MSCLYELTNECMHKTIKRFSIAVPTEHSVGLNAIWGFVSPG